MRTRTTLPFRAAPLRVEDPPSHGTILNAFLSSLALEERSACAVLFGAAARHFLHWLELHGIAIRVIDDRTVLRRGSGASSASWKIKATSKSTTGSTICPGTSPIIPM